jgi:oxygen-independent coproporphyrinogen-3 oxidase
MPQIFRAQRLIKDTDLPTAEVKMDLMELTIQRLTQAGYVYIGMDHFALPDDELCLAREQGRLQRNFQGYSTNSECDLIGIGVSAIGKVGDCFAQNLKDIPSWSRAVKAGVLPLWRGISLNSEDRLRQSVIEDIMCRARVNFAEYENRFPISFDEHFALEMDLLERLAEDGLLELDEDGLTVTSDGRLLLRIIASVFDEYLHHKTSQSLFSKVI